MNNPRYENGFEVTLHKDLVDAPRSWKKPRVIFVNSMSDLFHEKVPLEFIQSVFKTMNECPQHTFQILTKRSERLKKLSPEVTWSKNIWMGVSVENDEVFHRIHDLSETGAFIKFLSCEPLIGPCESLPLKAIDWVIVGGESGPRSRPMEKAWVESIRDQCEMSKVHFFFKQWGGVRKDLTGRKLDGKVYDAMPLL